MSFNKVTFRNSNQLYVQTDITKVFVFNNDFYKDNANFWYENSFSDGVLIPSGTVLGRNTSTGNLQTFNSQATDGTQIPVGILVNDLWVEYGETYSGAQAYCIRGQVAAQKLKFEGNDTVNTIIGGTGVPGNRRVWDVLTAIGIKIINSDQNLIYDNT